MESAYFFLGLSGVLTLLLWTPYILARMVVWGLPVILNNYPEGFPARQPEAPLWAQRAHRAHLNMVETLPAFGAVVLAAGHSFLNFTSAKSGSIPVVSQSITRPIVPVGAITETCALR